MTQKQWASLSLTLFLALVVAVLVLPPWSPASLTSQSVTEPKPQSEQVTPQAANQAPALTLQVPENTLVATVEPRVASAAPTTTPKPQVTPSITAPPDSRQTQGPTATSEPAQGVSDAPEVNPEQTNEVTPDPASRSVEDLILATEDPDWKTRWDAVNDLGNLKDPKAIPSLAARALYDDNSHPRWRSLWALASVNPGGADVIPYLEIGLDESDHLVVRNAAVALAFFSQPQARPELLRGLHDPDSYRRWEAVFSLKKLGNVEVAEALIPLLNAEIELDTRVRQEVSLTLGRMGGGGGEEVVRALLDAAKHDPSPQVRWRAAMGLSRLGDSSLVAELEMALAMEEDLRVREFIEAAISKIGSG